MFSNMLFFRIYALAVSLALNLAAQIMLTGSRSIHAKRTRLQGRRDEGGGRTNFISALTFLS